MITSLYVAREEVGSKQHLLALATYMKLIMRYATAEHVGDCVNKQIGSGEVPR